MPYYFIEHYFITSLDYSLFRFSIYASKIITSLQTGEQKSPRGRSESSSLAKLLNLKSKLSSMISGLSATNYWITESKLSATNELLTFSGIVETMKRTKNVISQVGKVKLCRCCHCCCSMLLQDCCNNQQRGLTVNESCFKYYLQSQWIGLVNACKCEWGRERM